MTRTVICDAAFDYVCRAGAFPHPSGGVPSLLT
jgi:hypothetical protein